jgi:HEAT repeat protein
MFDAETNPMLRHKIIKQLPSVLKRFGIHSPPSWAMEMLDKALGDAKAGVAETAAREIGDLGVQSLVGRLLDVYNTAPAKYSFSAGVRNGIIYALGKINDNQSKMFLVDMLSVNKRYAEIHEALDAIGSTNDASYIPYLQRFIDDRQAIVDNADTRNDRSDAAERMREQLRHALSIMRLLRG